MGLSITIDGVNILGTVGYRYTFDLLISISSYYFSFKFYSSILELLESCLVIS